MVDVIELKIRKIIEENILKDHKLPVDDAEIDLSKHGMDSMNFIELAVFIEKEFGFQFKDSDLNFDNFITLDKITSYVKERIS